MEADFQRRKRLAITAFKTLEKFITNKKSSTKNKIRRFDCFIGSIFLYNTELWAPTKRVTEKINILHRSFLRKIMNKKWNDKIQNKDLYMMTNTIPWSNVIRERRIKFLGHILRQQEPTPARQALQEMRKPIKTKIGRPKQTWWALVK